MTAHFSVSIREQGIDDFESKDFIDCTLYNVHFTGVKRHSHIGKENFTQLAQKSNQGFLPPVEPEASASIHNEENYHRVHAPALKIA